MPSTALNTEVSKPENNLLFLFFKLKLLSETKYQNNYVH